MNDNLNDLNTILFSQLKRLDTASDDQLEGEMKRARAVTGVAREIIGNGNLMIKVRTALERDMGGKTLAPLIGE